MRWFDRDRSSCRPSLQTERGRNGWTARRIIWLNFLLSIGVGMVLCVIGVARSFLHVENIWSYFGPFAVKMLARPIVWLFLESMLLHAVRWPDGARPFALFLGIMALCFVLVELLTTDLLQRPVNWLFVGIVGYVGISHLLYSVVGREGAGSQESILIIEKDKPGDDPADWWKRLGGRSS